MRIERLDLTRYGHFTEFPLDLGRNPDGADFHIIYGANEAGKSTIRNAFIDLLYGISSRTPYNFLHANDALQIGADVTIAGESRALVRVRKNSGSLFGADGQVVAESELKAALGDITRDSYRNMFSLDGDTLQDGGESILKSEGDLGELLFAAASGLSGVSGALADVRTQAEGFYKVRGRTHRLALAKKELKDLETNIRDLDTQAHTYDALIKDEGAKSDLYETAKSKRDSDAKRSLHLRAVIDCLEPRQDRADRLTRLEPLKGAPALPTGWIQDAEELSRKEEAAKASLANAKTASERLKETLKNIPSDVTIVQLSEAIERLTTDDTEARFRAATDIEKLMRYRARSLEDIKAKLKLLDRPASVDPDSLLLPAATIGRLNELAAKQGGVETAAQNAEDEFDRAQRRREKASAAIAEFDDISDLTDFVSSVATLRTRFEERDLELAEGDVSRCEAEIQQALLKLAPWKGSAVSLRQLTVPERSRLEKLKADERSGTDERLALDRDIERLKDEKADFEAQLQAERDAGVVINDKTAAAARAVRDKSWKQHLDLFESDEPAPKTNLKGTATIFASAMAEDDRITELRFHQSTEIASLRSAQNECERRQAALDRTGEKAALIDKRDDTLATEIVEMMQCLGLPDDTSLSFLDAWTERRTFALEKFDHLLVAEAERDKCSARHTSAIATLSGAMSAAGLAAEGEDWSALMAAVDQAIAHWDDRSNAKAEVIRKRDDAVEDEVERKRLHDRARKAAQEWTGDWNTVLGACWIGDAAKDASPAEVSEILRLLQEVSILVDKTNDFDERIAAMKLDRETYVGAVKKIAGAADEVFDASSPLHTADALRARLQIAQENDRRREERIDEREAEEKREQEAHDLVEEIAQRFAEMAAVFPAGDFVGIIDAMRASETKSKLEDEIENIEHRICLALGVADFAAAEAILDEEVGTPALIEDACADYQSLTADWDAASAHVADLFHDWKTAEKELAAIGGDAQVAQLEEQKHTLLLSVAAEAETFLRLSAGAMVVEHALRVYRDSHRSSMMDRASNAFAAITRGAFTALAAMPGKDQEILVGLRARGGSIVASEMSRGTRFQLFLALRIAGYAEFVRQREALPFFADDILEPFDDDRSAETFSLLADMAKSGQVIYLTHHRHLCEIARSASNGSVIIHELPDPLA
jgi:uncharacterized protein YhaN